MNRRFQKQVNPRTTALVILIVLAIVQVVWWRGLVMKPGGSGERPAGGGSAPPGVLFIEGRMDVTVDTVAGAPDPGCEDGLCRNARFDAPTGLAIDQRGNLYVADCRNHRIRVVSPEGVTSTIAGGEAGCADGSVADARFYAPCGVAVGTDGAVYVADTGNNRIRRILNGRVSTLAGGDAGMADGSGPAARFNKPCSLVYQTGSKPPIIVADTLNRCLRTVSMNGDTRHGQQMPGLPVQVGDGTPPVVSVPQAGAFICGAQSIRNLPVVAVNQEYESSSGGFKLQKPQAACRAPNGWFVIDYNYGAVFHVYDGKAELLAGYCQAKNTLLGYRDNTGDRALFGRLGGIAYDGKGHLYVSDITNNAIRRLTLPEDVVGERGQQTESRD